MLPAETIEHVKPREPSQIVGPEKVVIATPNVQMETAQVTAPVAHPSQSRRACASYERRSLLVRLPMNAMASVAADLASIAR